MELFRYNFLCVFSGLSVYEFIVEVNDLLFTVHYVYLFG